MPEDGEVRASGKLLHQCLGWQITESTKFRYSKWCIKSMNKIQQHLPLTIADVQTQGKELTLIFSNQCALLFNLGTGAAFYVGRSDEKNLSPLDYRTNLALECANGRTIFVVDCHNTQNQVRLSWRKKTEPIWSVGRGPDLLDTEENLLIRNVQSHVENSQYQRYFEEATLIECLINQSLFNGIGAYTSSEICYWLYQLKGVRPWITFKAFCTQSDGNLRTLVRIIRVYLQFMEKYISIHGSNYSCIDFNEWKWLDFRAVFLRTYRQPSTILQNGQRIKVQKFTLKVTKAGGTRMKITKSKAQCFTPSLSDDEEPPRSWQEKKVNPIGKNSLGVGWFSWFGVTDRKITLDSPRKNAIQLRPPTLEHLLPANNLDQDGEFDNDIESEEEGDFEAVLELENSQSHESPLREANKRASRRMRVVNCLNKEMANVSFSK